MFSMEEVGSAQHNSGKQRTPGQRAPSLSEANDSGEDDYYICPITDDPVSQAKDICVYLKNLVHSNQLSNSPQNSFMYKVSSSSSVGAILPGFRRFFKYQLTGNMLPCTVLLCQYAKC